MIQSICRSIIEGIPLPPGAIGSAFDDLISGCATPAQAGAFLTALRHHTLTGEDLSLCASYLLSHARPLSFEGAEKAVDTCGTGGDHAMTFNISTAAAFVTAGAGIPVLKHGNRAVTSRSGSADLLAELGVAPGLPAGKVGEALRIAGIAFLPAGQYHPVMRSLAPIRSELGFRTIFNILGPLSHPAGPVNRLLGVADPALLHPMAEALRSLGVRRALVVSGAGLDELALHGENRILELKEGTISEYTLLASDLGLSDAPVASFRVENPVESAGIVRLLLGGEEGPCRDIVLLNAAGAIIAGGGAETFPAALSIAEASIDDGRAAECLRLLAGFSGGDLS
ncbi:anthranilate phosphoribosyltransferase [Methanocalculus chunghsingensis]|uniref:anthranilate phosphoribosyltransferase n=1 Tax=Methanocalculus chunghsingensis TaxID=156457 RepID=UPI001B8BF861|nr:anthranilate phosphoribosyltransferase [Methanocalculus chunghsingensis]